MTDEKSVHRIQNPNEQGRSHNPPKEPLPLDFLVVGSTSPIHSQLIDCRQISCTRNNEPKPPHSRMIRERPKNTSTQEDEIRRDRNHQIRAWKARQQRQTHQRQRIRDEPVHIAQPEDLTEVVVDGVRDVFVDLRDGFMLVGHALTGS